MKLLMANPILTVGVISWLAAQILKTIHYAVKYKTFDPERITGAGGMPSSHSSLVVSVAIYTLRSQGFSSPAFALSMILAGVVIYDAMSVRYNAGLHAKELNRLRKVIDEMDDEISQLSGEEDEEASELTERRDFKEFLGHTPLEVLAGSLLGIIIAMVFPLPGAGG
ncbi:MAG: divergent PAP2 family protein [Oscillospiraceae bacterium]|nr:divergent PAP2 family protein [Oscillospiraceae bacterium]